MRVIILFASHGGELFGLLFIVATAVAMASTVAIYRKLYRVRPSALLRVLGMTYVVGAIMLIGASMLFSGPPFFFLFLVLLAFVGLIVVILLGAIHRVVGPPASLR